ncbi:hypothetical protein AVEN_49107-1 [Araneus ventricosus]|uniref:Uncharacterized protein n=1 Tax=Araneus ventricosus TaxID=182803 RepID=A0A4Y2BZT4_ARAVE|nr:hypothetical protein AVEN_49107-1 [Araneus ventricosus]
MDEVVSLFRIVVASSSVTGPWRLVRVLIAPVYDYHDLRSGDRDDHGKVLTYLKELRIAVADSSNDGWAIMELSIFVLELVNYLLLDVSIMSCISILINRRVFRVVGMATREVLLPFEIPPLNIIPGAGPLCLRRNELDNSLS